MLGERLRTLRLRTNQTQQQIADQLGITRAAYSHFENDRNEPDGETIVKLAEIFQVSTDLADKSRQASRHPLQKFKPLRPILMMTSPMSRWKTSSAILNL